MGKIFEPGWALGWLGRLEVASHFADLVAIYLLVGVFVGLYVVIRGVDRLDPSAAAGTWGFRCLILPGVVALWPWMLARCWRATPLAQPKAGEGET